MHLTWISEKCKCANLIILCYILWSLSADTAFWKVWLPPTSAIYSCWRVWKASGYHIRWTHQGVIWQVWDTNLLNAGNCLVVDVQFLSIKIQKTTVNLCGYFKCSLLLKPRWEEYNKETQNIPYSQSSINRFAWMLMHKIKLQLMIFNSDIRHFKIMNLIYSPAKMGDCIIIQMTMNLQ